MSQYPIPKRISQIQTYAKTLSQAARLLDERRYILEPLIKDTEIKDALVSKIGTSYGTHSYNHLAPLFATDLVRDISRLFLDNDKQVASLQNLYRKASDKKLFNALKKRFRSIPDRLGDPALFPGFTKEESEKIAEQWLVKDRDEFEQSFNEGWDEVSSAIEAIKNDSIAKKIKTYRDCYLAHLEMTPLGEEAGPVNISSLKLTFDDIFIFLDKYMPIIFEFTRILTGTVVCIDDFSKHHKRCGLDLWKRFAG